MTGYADTDLFGPSNELTRAEFVTVLHRIVDPEATGVDFTTVKNETGFVDVEFQPNTPVDRQTMCVILSRYLKAENPSMDKLNSMPDADGVADWAIDGVAWALNEGVISGVDVDGIRYIQADTILSRAMAAQVIANSCYNYLL